MRRLYWIVAPLPNAAMAVVLLACLGYSIWPQEQYRVPLIVGALIGLLPAVLDAAARLTIGPALRSATNFGEVVLAYRPTPLARARHALTIVLLIAAVTYLGWSNDANLVGVIGGLALTHFFAHAILGFWTAWPDKADSDAL
jgi:hypothetical protein